MGEKLFAKLDIGFADHAKIIGLSDSAFRAFIEAMLYARQQLTDGFLDERVVLRKWGQEVVNELTTNDPSNPSWVRVDGGFMIHDYSKNQMTNADIEAKRAAGRRGGLAKAENMANKNLAPATNVLEQTSSETLLEKIREDKEIENKELKRGTRIQKPFTLSNEMIQWAVDKHPLVDYHTQTEAFIDYWTSQPGQKGVKADWVATWRNWIRNSKPTLQPTKPVADPNAWMKSEPIVLP